MNSFTKIYIYKVCLLLLVVVVAGCGSQKTLRGVFKKETPYERYASSLKDANLHQTALGQEWLSAGNRALQDSITITLPFKETGYFAADKPRALGYRLEAQRGERIVVDLELRSQETTAVFMDLFEATTNKADAPKHVATADTTSVQLVYEVNDDRPHILRLQPELLRSAQYTVTVQVKPTMAFPVPGKSSRNISSIWGDPRDAGARRHEGVDIFAPRGTPVIASVDGTVTRIGTSPRGGNVVWLSDTKRRQNLYYAHLDKQLVAPGQRVSVGDTLGLVGNTGNAKTTAPHLHFGIYRAGMGATNPYPYLHQPTQAPPAVAVDGAKIGNWVRVAARQANIRLQPSAKTGVFGSLPQHTPLQVTGATGNWYRVQLPNGAEGYISATLVETITRPVRQKTVALAAEVLDAAHPAAPVKDSLAAGSKIAVLGLYKNFELVQLPAGDIGWLHEPVN
ncbi:peptidoglycan DD-metalloendopeptidase family protein [Pontibacter qinzhouensis]|uniref:Peptidoglycan DD-metalloendopeptidase family protein n=2 Tax=Pontibacter qinzhouensis TaxID=2603253 RepID=A0A5C8J0A4_9BACT|nr:peptidoglycan DD-metalloendopeptidase family protein [Pontibacter qinzhouensis]